MQKTIVFTFCVFLYSFSANAQSAEIERVLREIEQNNPELQAYASYMESRKLELRSGNNLPDPQADVYYLPWGQHETGNYTEYQVSQSFEFPSVYGARNKLIDEQQKQLELSYSVKRQNILLSAKGYCQEIIYLNKQVALEETRTEQAERVFDHVNELFDKEQVGILELNKAKVSWMQQQFAIEQLEAEKRSLLLQLQSLNGGNEITFDQSDFTDDLELLPFDSLWVQKTEADPAFRSLKQEEDIAMRQLSLSKNRSLPNLMAGYNYQGVSSSNYSGIYAGLTIPLWSNHNKVKAAKANLNYQQSFIHARWMMARAELEKQYNEYQVLLNKFKEYQTTLGDLNSDPLLLQAYELGEISFMEYYMEIQFYRQAYNALLKMENELHQLKTEMMKYEL